MKVGSLVECIKSFEFATKELREVPKKGKIYSIRTIGKGVARKNKTFVRLEEVVNPVVRGIEPQFYIEAFREVVPPMSISVEEIIHAEV